MSIAELTRVPPVEIMLKQDINEVIRIAMVEAGDLMKQQEYAEARALYEKLLVRFPEAYRVEPYIARTYYAEKNYEEAVKHLRIAVEKDPSDQENKRRLGNILMDMGISKGKRDSFWALDLLAQNGFAYGSSIAPLRFIGIPNAPTIPYTLSTPHGEIREFPPLVMPSLLGNLPIGGGWGLRILPYRSIRRGIESLNHLRHPVLIFCHPSHFDTQSPPLPLPWVKPFACYGKIRTTEERLTRLLGDFEFAPIRGVMFKENGRDS